MNEALEDIYERLELPEKLNLPRAKGSFRPKKLPYQEIMTSDDKEKVAKMFAKEIALFDYKFWFWFLLIKICCPTCVINKRNFFYKLML